tara:strand:- start:4508 stop:4696 length:189 start_codon:yes stop_codon:yes gene_type:complete
MVQGQHIKEYIEKEPLLWRIYILLLVLEKFIKKKKKKMIGLVSVPTENIGEIIITIRKKIKV